MPLLGFEISPFSGQNRVILGGRGVPEIFFLLESSYFCYLGAHAKFQIHTICPYWGLATVVTRTRTRVEESTKNSGLRRFRRNRLHSAARTNLDILSVDRLVLIISRSPLAPPGGQGGSRNFFGG